MKASPPNGGGFSFYGRPVRSGAIFAVSARCAFLRSLRTVSGMFSEFNNYDKWFALHNYDYAIHSTSRGFMATASPRDSSEVTEGPVCASARDALHELYLLLKTSALPSRG